MDQRQCVFNPHREEVLRHRIESEPYRTQANTSATSSLMPLSESRPLFLPPTSPAHFDRVPNPNPTFPLSPGWDLQTPDSVANRPKKIGRKNAPLGPPRRQFTAFFQRVPDTREGWNGARALLGLTSLEGIAKAIDDIIWSGDDVEQFWRPRNLTDYITHRASTATSIGGPDRVTSLPRYGPVVFLGACCVARQLGIREECVDKAVKQFLGNTMSPARSSRRACVGRKTQRMYQKVPIWITRQEDILYDHRGHLASEMFLHAAMSLSNFDGLARSGSDERFHKEAIANIPSDTTLSPETKLPFYLPFIVWACILQQTDTDCYEQLKPALGAGKFTHADFRTWFEIYQQNTTKPMRGYNRPLSDIQPQQITKRQRTDPQRSYRSPPHTAASGLSGALAQAGGSAPSLLVGSNADKGAPEQGLVTVIARDSGSDVIDAEAAYYQHYCPRLGAVTRAIPETCPPFCSQTLNGVVPRTDLQNHRLPQMPTYVGADQFTPSSFGRETAFHGSQLEKPVGYVYGLIGPVEQPPAQIENITVPFSWPREVFRGGIDGNYISHLAPVYHKDSGQYLRGP